MSPRLGHRPVRPYRVPNLAPRYTLYLGYCIPLYATVPVVSYSQTGLKSESWNVNVGTL